MISKKEALRLIEHSSKREHLLQTAAVMRAVAKRLGENESEWELVGLLHDLDYDLTTRRRTMHGIIAAERLDGKLPEHCLHAIRSHDFRSGVRPRSRLDMALISSDTIVNYLSAHKTKRSFSDTMIEIEKLSIDRPWIKTNILSCSGWGLEPEEFVRISEAARRELPKVR